jgi:predicted Ser/Thr protein kinase
MSWLEWTPTPPTITESAMPMENDLLDLVIRWEELRAAGQTISPEELCRDRPDLLDRVREHLKALGRVDNVLSDATASLPLAGGMPGGAALANLSSQVPPPTTAWPSIPGYEIVEELNHGGMGVVYKARQIGLDRMVAIKTILPRGPIGETHRARFLREAKMMALLQHPNLLPIYEVGQRQGQPFLVMEYVGGGTLSKSLDGKPMPPQKAAELAAVLARAVHFAHAQGVIHRDLKPSNVLLAADGTPKIGDFGLAKCFDSPSDHTQTGQLLGTPSYMAPEQLGDASAKVGPSVDVYALGATLYELLSGRPPFLADNPLDTLQMVRLQEPIPLSRWQPKIPVDLDTICLKCLEKDPRRRYVSALALADDLERFVRGEPIAARPAGALERCCRWSRAHRTGAVSIAGALVALTAILMIVLAFNHRLAGELAHTNAEHERLLATRERLHRELTSEVAGRLNSDLRELAAVPSTMATLLERHDDWDETRLAQTMHDMLLKSPLIFGLCVAMEPFQWRADRQDFALYMYRSSKGLVSRQLLPPRYQPIYRQWDWYRAGRDSTAGRWGEPYVGLGADRTPMVTFSAPIRRHGRFVGVITADLAMDYFHKLRASLDDLEPGSDFYCFLISPGGQILSHSQDRYEFPSPESNVDKLRPDITFRNLLGQMRKEKEGIVKAIDPVSGKSSTFLFSRVPSADWTFVVVKQ